MAYFWTSVSKFGIKIYNLLLLKDNFRHFNLIYVHFVYGSRDWISHDFKFFPLDFPLYSRRVFYAPQLDVSLRGQMKNLN